MLQIWSVLTILFLVIQSPAINRQTESSSTNQPLTMGRVWTLDATYSDPKHGVTFRYPSVWRAATQFGYHPPALTDSFAPPVAGFAYDLGGFPRGQKSSPYSSTNLEGFGVLYSAIDTASAAECMQMAASLSDFPEHHTVVFGGRSFSVYETGEDGMSQIILGSLYVTYANHTCYFFETDKASASVGALDSISALTTAQSRFIDAHLLKIMKSVRIAPRR